MVSRVQLPPEVQLAQRLAGNEQVTRDRAVRKLRKYIVARTQRAAGGRAAGGCGAAWAAGPGGGAGHRGPGGPTGGASRCPAAFVTNSPCVTSRLSFEVRRGLRSAGAEIMLVPRLRSRGSAGVVPRQPLRLQRGSG